MQVKLQSKCYFQEAKWSNEKYTPNLKEQMEVSILTAACSLQSLAALMAEGNEVTNKEAFEWARGAPDMVLAGGEIGRLLNDIAAFKVLGT